MNGEEAEMTLRETRRQESTSKGGWDRTVYHPTGKLILELKSYPNGVTCTDGTLLLEDQLPKILARIQVMSQQAQEWRIELDKRQKEYEEEQQNAQQQTVNVRKFVF